MGKGKGNKRTGETVLGARFLSQGRIVCQTGQVGLGKTIGLIGANQAVENRSTLHGSQLVRVPRQDELGFIPKSRAEFRHHRKVDHGGFVQNHQVLKQSVLGVPFEINRSGLPSEKTVQSGGFGAINQSSADGIR